MTTISKFSSNEFSTLASRLWGYGWQTKAARHFEVSDRSVRRWVAGAPIPEGVMKDLRAMADIAPPDGSIPGEDRDAACRLAIEPALTEMRNRAVTTGWNHAEVDAAIMSATIHQIRLDAGDNQARHLLLDAAKNF